MESPVHHHRSGADPDDPAPQPDGTSLPAVPGALRWLVAAAAVGVVLLVALPTVMALDRGFTARMIMDNRPDLDPAHLDFAVNGAILYSVVLHAVDVVLTVWFVIKVLHGRRWARIALTAYLVIATVGSLNSVTAGTQILWVVIAGDGLHLVMLALLWLPGSVRRFFTAHRCAAPGHAAATSVERSSR